MATRVNARLLQEIKRYGAFDISACFNCGNCTAVCALSRDNDVFPRRPIRYAQLGLREHLIANKELWLCHHCGECSETCPRQAGPAEFMAAARRHAIVSFDPSGLSRLLHLSTWATAAIVFLLAVVFAGLLLWRSAGVPATQFSTAAMLDFVPFETLHHVGIAVLAILGVIAALTVVNMLWTISSAPVPGGVGKPADVVGMFPVRAVLKAAMLTIADIVSHSRQRGCTSEQEDSGSLLLRRWFVHLCIMGGFLGLAAATGLDYLLKDPDLHVMPWSPIRLLGIVSGLLVTYGTTVAIVRRLAARRKGLLSAGERYYAHTLMSDWLFLCLLWLVAVTGFVLTAAIYLPVQAHWPYIVFVVHVVLALELLILMPFTKFAHAVYRPVAIWFQHFRRLRLAAQQPTAATRSKHA
jgi:ferredoxin/nitrate reductase gamma subunit